MLEYGAVSYDDLRSFVDLQLNTNLQIFEALPEWVDYFNEAVEIFPELWPRINHLIRK